MLHQSIYKLRDITANKIDNYLHARKHEGINYHEFKTNPVSDTTIRHDYIGIRAFLRWCKQRGYIQRCVTDQVTPPKRTKKLPQILHKDDIARLMEYLTSKYYNIPYQSVPVKYIVFVELFSGLRFKHELLQLRKKDIVVFCDDRNNKFCEIYVHKTKSGTPKIVPVNIALYELLKPWLDTKKDNELLFPISEFPRKQWKQVCEIVGIDISPYKLKHTFATDFYLRTGNIIALKEILGHTDINTTNIYTQIANAQLHKHAQSYQPGAPTTNQNTN